MRNGDASLDEKYKILQNQYNELQEKYDGLAANTVPKAAVQCPSPPMSGADHSTEAAMEIETPASAFDSAMALEGKVG